VSRRLRAVLRSHGCPMGSWATILEWLREHKDAILAIGKLLISILLMFL
jgi:hypothetical protein